MQETLYLYRQFYDRPVSLPSLLASELSSDNMALDPAYRRVSLLLLLSCNDNIN